MATLELSDGDTTVNFLNETGLHIVAGGYRTQVGQVDPVTGEILSVVDILPCFWADATDDARDVNIQNLLALGVKAADKKRLRRRDRWVWLASSTWSETGTRYAVVTKVEIPDGLSPDHWGADQGVDLVVAITREGAAREVAPNATPTTAISAETVYNKEDADGDHWVELSPTQTAGDAPTLLHIEIDPGSSPIPVRYLVGIKSHKTQATLAKFHPWFNPDDEVDFPGDQTADTNAPDDVRLETTVDRVYKWQLDSTNRPLSVYAGSYHVYAFADTFGTGSSTLKFGHGGLVFGDAVTTADVGSPSTGTYLGRFTLPAGNYISTIGDPATYDLTLNVDITGSETVELYGLLLLPIDDRAGLFDLQNAAIDASGVVVINGPDELVYEVDTSGNYRASSATLFDRRGPFLTAEPGAYNRLYFVLLSLANLWVPNHTAAVTVKTVRRYRAIRGNL